MRFTSGAVSLDFVTPGTTVHIGGITQMDLPLNNEIVGDESGLQYDETQAILNQAPVPTATTKSMAAVLSAVSLVGECITTGDGLDFFANKVSTCKNPSTGAAHTRFRYPKGLVLLGQLNANRGQDALLTFLQHSLTDGTNAPISVAHSQALPTPLVLDRFVLGACAINNIVFDDLESLTLDFGISITNKTPALGSVWPDTVGSRKVQPVLTLPNFDVTNLDAAKIPIEGVSAPHATTILQFRKLKPNGGGFVPDATPEHIRITAYGLTNIQNAFTASGENEGTQAVELRGAFDGTNVPLVISPAVAYDPTPLTP